MLNAGGGIRTHESLRNRVVGNLQALSKPRTFTTCAVDRAWQPPHYLMDVKSQIYLLSLQLFNMN